VPAGKLRLISLLLSSVLLASSAHAESSTKVKPPKVKLEVPDKGAQLSKPGKDMNGREVTTKDINDYAREDSKRVVIDPSQVKRQEEKRRRETFPNVKPDEPAAASYD